VSLNDTESNLVTGTDAASDDTSKCSWLRAVEFTAVFVFVPPVLLLLPQRPPIIPTLWAVTAVALWVLLRDPSFDRRRFFAAQELKQRLPGILACFALGVVVLSSLVVILIPGELFSFPKHNPVLYAIVMCFYPILSVYPQTIVYRALVFHRYRCLFGSGWMMILVSGVAFGYSHLVLMNWVAPALTIAGGIIFARTYQRSGSLLISAIEHALWGCFMFTIGLGSFFYGGTVRLTASVAGGG
jgi:membrane protease YdiL (CAAX protease family)